MKNFSEINSIEELKENLEILKVKGISLLDIYEGSNNSYFEDLLDSDLMTKIDRSKLFPPFTEATLEPMIYSLFKENLNIIIIEEPEKILQTIVDTGMGFNINEKNNQLLQKLFNHVALRGYINKDNYSTIEILTKNFSLSKNSQIQPNQPVSEYLIKKSANDHELNLAFKLLIKNDLLSENIDSPIKNRYGNIIKVDSKNDLDSIINNTNHDNFLKTLNQLKKMGLEFNDGVIAIVLSETKNISLAKAIEALDIQETSTNPIGKIDSELLNVIVNLIKKCGNDNAARQELFISLAELGFSQWNDTLILMASSYNNQTWNLITELLESVDYNGNPIFNVNCKDENGMRLIDQAKKLYSNNIIIKLRSFGSVEPQKPIAIKKVAIDKLDLSNERLDGHKSNEINAPKIMQKMYQKFPLKDAEINKEISDYKAKDFTGWDNKAWFVSSIKSIPEIIDLLSSMVNVNDRLGVSWSFKKVLGTIIHIERTTNDDMLSNSLIYCLSNLYLCNLGKLINLLNVVQDIVLKSDNQEEEFNYVAQDFEYFQNIFTESMNKITVALREKSVSGVAKWFYDMYSYTPPENWSSETTKVQGIINKVFFEIGAQDGQQRIESYHYNKGLKDGAITPLVQKIYNEVLPQELSDWTDMVNEGTQILAENFFEKILLTKNKAEFDALFDNVEQNPALACGDFTSLKIDMIEYYLNQFLNQHPLKGLQFLRKLQSKFDLDGLVFESIGNEIDEINLMRNAQQHIQAQHQEQIDINDELAYIMNGGHQVQEAGQDNQDLGGLFGNDY
jgi:hypothetical protein